MMASRAPHFLAATAVLAALCAPAAAAINAPVFVAQLPIFSGGECTTSVAGSAAFSCANMRAQANTWSATQTIANVTSPGTVQGAQVTSTNNMTAAGTVTAGGALKAGAATITSSGIDVTGISIFRSAVTAPTPVANDNSTNVDTTANSQNRLSRVANAAALAAWANTAFPVERDGFATPGDGGRARYNWSSAACTAADGGSQITATAGGCWGIDTIGQTSVRVFGVLGQGDDSAAWAAALAWSGNTHHTLIDDVAQSILYANTRQLLTANATLVGGSSLEGADGTYYTNLPSVYFNGSGTGGGWTLGNNVTISGINFYSTTVDHCLEWTGKFDLENVQLDCPTSGGITTLNVVVGTAFTNNVNSGPFVNLGLTNGTYTKIPFTGSGGGSGATVTVVVSGGAITTVTPDGAGTVGAPYFIFGFASGALYSGSPTIASAGYFATANPGRSRIHNVYTVCESKYGLDVDGAFDFVDVTGLEYWCGAFKANAAAFHFGRIDGLTMSNQKVFGANIGVLSDGPGFFGGSFATFGNGAHDLVNTGYFLQTPLNNASIHGGFIRALSNAVLINNAGTNLV